MWRVMIADDEPYIREGLEKLIPWEELGCELIYVAENGQDLLEQIRSCPPDIAIIDIKMPLMDGMEVAEYIYKSYPDVCDLSDCVCGFSVCTKGNSVPGE